MEIILAAVIVLIIVAIVVLLIFKKKQQALDDEPVVPTQVLQKTQASSDAFDNFARADSKSEIDPFEKADRLINDNRHDEAINELKRLLLSNPKNSIAILKLLQVYVLTNNFSAFDKLHQKLKEIGDTAALEQAETYRLLLDDAVASETVPVAEETKIDTLEFDIGTSQPTSHDSTPAVSTAVQTPESLSDFEDFNFDSSPSNITTKADDGVFDLSFDTALSADTLSLDAQQKPTDSTALDLDGGLSFDTLSTSTTDDNAFDLNDFGIDTPASTTPAVNETSLDSSSFDLGFNLDSPSSEVSKSETPILETTSPALTDEFALDGFDLSPATPASKPDTTGDSLDFGDLDFGLESKESTVAKPVDVDFGSDNGELDLGGNDFGLELGDLDASVQGDDLASFNLDPIPANTVSNKEEFTLDGFDLDSGAPSLDTPSLDVSSLEINPLGTAATNDSFELGDLSFDAPTPEAPKATPNSLETDGGFDFDIAMGDSKPVDIVSPATIKSADVELDNFGFDLSSLATEEIAESSLEKKEEPTTDFDFLAVPSTPKRELTSSFDLSELAPAPASTPAFDDSMTAGLDASDITLDLAQQYISLGEYDSAKHLLEEVVNAGNAEQSRTASNLLKRLG